MNNKTMRIFEESKLSIRHLKISTKSRYFFIKGLFLSKSLQKSLEIVDLDISISFSGNDTDKTSLILEFICSLAKYCKVNV
mmetsp:Transcript_4635/g.3897  ORF Transcript_4635/g.3897 Transcript_4635/m.3897 type:complete len:81 (+) Transcript_4635:599-841(+)